MPSRNHIVADPEGIRDGGRHFNGDLASTVGLLRSGLVTAVAANEQPDAYDDETGRAFRAVYEPAKDDMLTLLQSLETAFRQAYDAIDATATNLIAVEETNTANAHALTRAVHGIR
ncbi:hypothetical protein [Streptomyces sp. NPDC003247]|uniref:hypothetical protein n=1 Tax=Streptomyces sp. NPDC003247 TaxID=3364677 RepID=UPI0036BF6252